jgi:MoxR-like ATPase
VREVYLNHDIKNYIVNLVTTSRQHPDVYLGASPRGALALYRTSQARAAIVGRDYVVPDDVKALAETTLAHRIIVGPNARIKDISSSSIVHNILNTVPVPGATVGARY